jgi:FtsP/CotA-like multicopper oxidase with cupredoxin domain
MFKIKRTFVTIAITTIGLLSFTLADAQQNPQAHTPTILVVKKVPITVNGKSSEVYRIQQPDGTWGYQGVKGEMFDAIVKNETDKPLVLHWHGLVVPNDQDGVPYVTQPPIPAGGEYHYHYKLVQSGTYWIHSHYQFQLQQQMSAPFIIYDTATEADNQQNVVMLLSDFSFKKPEQIYAELRNGMMQKNDSMDSSMTNMSMSKSANAMKMDKMSEPDLTDVQYDAFLTNYHTLAEPQIIPVKLNKTVRLRIIDGAGATNFFVNLGKLTGKLIAVDGEPIQPITGSRFSLVMGQRLDILVNIPTGEGSYPILAQGEGTTMQTGLILATPKAHIPSISEKAATTAGAITMQQELSLQPLRLVPVKPVTQTLTVNLEGDMQKYIWKLNGKVWPDYAPLETQSNEHVEMIFNNLTNMSHPMHIHGHVFEVTEINGKPIRGALRDTVLIPANGTVKIQFDTDNPGNWMIHCHVLYHSEGGMMGIMNYKGIPLPKIPAM